MAQPLQFTFHIDPGHGWLEVTLADLESNEVDISKISTYSYIKEDANDYQQSKVFLEEDGDIVLFLKAMEAKGWKLGEHMVFKEKYSENTFIRHLPRFNAEEYLNENHQQMREDASWFERTGLRGGR